MSRPTGLGVLALALVAAVAGARDLDFSATASLQEVTLLRHGKHLRVHGAHLVVSFPDPVTPRGPRGSTEGTLRLQCPTTILESFATLASVHKPPFIPAHVVMIHPSGDRNATHGSVVGLFDLPKSAPENEVHAFVVLETSRGSAHQRRADRALFTQIPRADIEQCVVLLVPAAEQGVQPPVEFVATRGNEVLKGVSSPVRVVTRVRSRFPGGSRRGDLRSGSTLPSAAASSLESFARQQLGTGYRSSCGNRVGSDPALLAMSATASARRDVAGGQQEPVDLEHPPGVPRQGVVGGFAGFAPPSHASETGGTPKLDPSGAGPGGSAPSNSDKKGQRGGHSAASTTGQGGKGSTTSGGKATAGSKRPDGESAKDSRGNEEGASRPAGEANEGAGREAAGIRRGDDDSTSGGDSGGGAAESGSNGGKNGSGGGGGNGSGGGGGGNGSGGGGGGNGSGGGGGGNGSGGGGGGNGSGGGGGGNGSGGGSSGGSGSDSQPKPSPAQKEKPADDPWQQVKGILTQIKGIIQPILDGIIQPAMVMIKGEVEGAVSPMMEGMLLPEPALFLEVSEGSSHHFPGGVPPLPEENGREGKGARDGWQKGVLGQPSFGMPPLSVEELRQLQATALYPMPTAAGGVKSKKPNYRVLTNKRLNELAGFLPRTQSRAPQVGAAGGASFGSAKDEPAQHAQGAAGGRRANAEAMDSATDTAAGAAKFRVSHGVRDGQLPFGAGATDVLPGVGVERSGGTIAESIIERADRQRVASQLLEAYGGSAYVDAKATSSGLPAIFANQGVGADEPGRASTAARKDRLAHERRIKEQSWAPSSARDVARALIAASRGSSRQRQGERPWSGEESALLETGSMQRMQGKPLGGAPGMISEKLSRDLEVSVPAGATGPLAAQLPMMLQDSVAEALSEQMRDYLANGLDVKLTSSLSDSLTHSLVPEILTHADELMGPQLSELLAGQLQHVLSRSLSLSIAPALAHTVAHNPLQDYYCFYCMKHKAYCQYCHVAPSQLYYAEYYVAYYSSYYAAFYDGEATDLAMKTPEFGAMSQTDRFERRGAAETTEKVVGE